MKQYKREITVISLADAGRIVPFLERDLILEIPEKSFDRRNFDILLRQNELTFIFGCKHIPYMTIKHEYEVLEGIHPATFSGKILKKVATKTIATKSPIVSESDDYFILENQRAYKKTDYYSEDYDFKAHTVITSRASGYKPGLYYDGHFLGLTAFVKEKLKEMVEFGEAILTFINTDKKEE